MSGALAWQVKKTLIKSLFFVFEGEMVRGFARLSPSCVLRLFGFCWFFLDFVLPNSLSNPISCSSCLYLSLEWMILHRFEQIGTSTRQLFVFIKQANARMGLARHDYSVQEDHLALMMELLGMMPRKIALGGRYSREFFNRYGDLRHIRRLRFWPLKKVLMEKYEFSEQDAIDMADFIVPILDFVPEKRPTAAQCLSHPWLSAGPRLLEPSRTQATESGTSEKKKEKDEREAMEVGVGNMFINGGASRPEKEPNSTADPPK